MSQGAQEIEIVDNEVSCPVILKDAKQLSSSSPEEISEAISILTKHPVFPNFSNSIELGYEIWNACIEASIKDVSTEIKIRKVALDMLEALLEDKKKGFVHVQFIFDSMLDTAIKCKYPQCLDFLNTAYVVLQKFPKDTSKRNEANFRYHFNSAECHFNGDDIPTAIAMARSAKDSLVSLTCPDSVNLGIFCYNSGAKMHHNAVQKSNNQDLFQLGAEWAILSVESLDRYKCSTRSSRSFRLLASCYLSLGQNEKCLKACKMSMEISVGNAQTLALCVRLYIKMENEKDLKNTLQELMKVSQLDVSTAVFACQSLKDGGKKNLLLQVLPALEDRFQLSTGYGDLRLIHVEALMIKDQDLEKEGQMDVDGIEKRIEIPQILRSTIQEHQQGDHFLSTDILSRLHSLCFNCAIKSFDSDHTKLSASWLSMAIFLLPNDDALGQAQLHRLLCRAYLARDMFEQARDSAMKAIAFNPKDAMNHYLVIRSLLLMQNVEAAVQSVSDMASKCSNVDERLWEDIAALATASGLPHMVYLTLKQFISVARCDVVVYIRRWIKATLQIEDEKERWNMFAEQIKVIKAKGESLLEGKDANKWTTLYGEKKEEELQWLIFVAWNSATSALDAGCFLAATTVFEMVVESSILLDSTKHLLPLSHYYISVCVLSLPAQQLDRTLASKALSNLASFASTKEFGNADVIFPTQETTMLLEFRARMAEGSPDSSIVKNFLEKSRNTISNPDFYEQLAVASLNFNRDLAVKCLDLSFSLHCSASVLDLKRCGIVVRTLVELMDLATGPSSNDDELFRKFKQVEDLLKKQNGWPEIERKWMSLKCWNRGSQAWRRNKFVVAEKWCSVALGLAANSQDSAWIEKKMKMKKGYQQLLEQIKPNNTSNM